MFWDFLRTAKLGPVHLNMSRAEVVHSLGSTEITSEERGIGVIWKYGNLQLWFVGDRLHQIEIDLLGQSGQLPAILEPLLTELPGIGTLQELTTKAASRDVEFLRTEEHLDEIQIALQTRSNVKLIFDSQTGQTVSASTACRP